MKNEMRFVVYGLLFGLAAVLAYLIFVNYLHEGSIRAKISGTRQILRNCAVAINDELNTNHRLPQGLEAIACFQPLPAPLAQKIGPNGQQSFQYLPEYYRFAQPSPKAWLLINTGPDKKFDLDPAVLSQLAADRPQRESCLRAYLYDPSNGTRSGGDLFYLVD